ncbi:hypothetical protein JRO89_XS03G0327700 [Xanthoceras sorbifolium]|uniref:Pre-mRNA-splicing factor 38 n=1 Tax=Xanthoceras sorbifolium TaxID=99658 RepID=A0ABQ8IDK2_9ROSI|nr:hypothetical protein JRO89_XS03G0327700 [Xanthoceras sorbifolium]
MANRTDPAAKSIRGTNPQNLVEKIVRSKIYQNTYWKEQCFGLTAETLVDKAMELDHLGRHLRRQPQAHPFHVPRHENAPDPAREGHRHMFVWNLETAGTLDLRKSVLEDDFEEEEEKEENDQLDDGLEDGGHEKDYHHGRSPTRERDRDRRRDSYKYRYKTFLFIFFFFLWVPVFLLERYSYLFIYNDILFYHCIFTLAFKAIGGLKQLPTEISRDPARFLCTDSVQRESVQDRRKRSHSRSRSRSRDRKRRGRSSMSPRRHAADEPEDAGVRADPKKKKVKKEKKDDGTDHPDPEIAEANRIRASLGLKPLKL